MAMFESFFEMENTPFGRNVPPEYLYQPEHISEAKGRLRYVAKPAIRDVERRPLSVILRRSFRKMTTSSCTCLTPS